MHEQLRRCLVALLALLAEGQAHAQESLLPPQSRLTIGVGLLDTQYQDAHDNNEFDAKETAALIGYKAALGKRLAIGGTIGLALQGQTTGDLRFSTGSGLRLALSGDFLLHQFSGNELIGSLGIGQDRFTYKESGQKLELTATDLVLAFLIRHRVSQLNFYGGLQLFLVDQDSADFSTPVLSSTMTIKRSQLFSVKLGATADVAPTVDVRLDLLLFGEQSIIIAADFKV